MSMFCMVPFGVGEMIGGSIVGYVTDKISIKAAVLVNVLFCLLTCGATLSFLIVNEYNWLAFMMPLMWGILDSGINTHIFEMLGFEFDTNSEPFAVFTLVEAMTVFVF